MVRRGFAARYGEPDQIERVRLKRGEKGTRHAPRGDFELKAFEPYHLTLVAAGDNGVWHRDSIDLMYEWLLRNPKARCEKHVVPEYNIQELYWAKDARSRTYGLFANALGA
jgi:hypothetical protein